MFRAHIQIRIGKDIHVRADATEGDPYAAFDTAASKVTRQMGRYKERLRDHRERLEKLPEGATTPARDYTLSANEDGGEGAAAAHAKDPVIIAELATGIQAMSVSDAVMRMDLSGAPAMLFRNPKNDAINLVYRRADGNIGWVDTEAGRRKSADKPAAGASAKKAKAAKPAAKKAAKKPAAKKSAAKKPAARGAAKSRAPGNIKKLAAARKAGVKKAATKKTAAKKTGAKKAAAKKSAARKSTTRKSTTGRPAAKRAKGGRR
jgi:hypothetical protein